MNPTDRNVLTAVVQEVFETMFFTFVDPIGEDEMSQITSLPGPYFHGQIGVKGENGRKVLDIFIPDEMANSLTETILRKEDNKSVSKEELIDTTKEIANMALGNILNKTNKEGTQRLTTPTAELVGDISPFIKDSGMEHIYFETDWGIMVVLFACG
ncbi:MAG: chemotaxis protein CheX [Thermodesulfobacteriota bacterium]